MTGFWFGLVIIFEPEMVFLEAEPYWK